MAFFSKDLPLAAGNILGSAAARVTEAATKVVATFNGNATFKKVATQAPTLDNAVRLTSQQIEASMTNVYVNNDMTTSQSRSIAASNEASVAAQQTRNDQGAYEADDSHKIKLVQTSPKEPGGTRSVVFRVMPEVFESRTAEYEPIAPPQAPGAFQKYKGTSSTRWTVNATLTSRTTDEATQNLIILNQLRAWTMPYFGENTVKNFPGTLGAPPPILTFSGFREYMIGPVPVVLTSCSWTFPQDVDYIPATELKDGGKNIIPFPTVLKVAIELIESFSTDQFNGFSLSDFRQGRMLEAWKPLRTPSPGMRSPSPVAKPEAQTIQPSSASSTFETAPNGDLIQVVTEPDGSILEFPNTKAK